MVLKFFVFKKKVFASLAGVRWWNYITIVFCISVAQRTIYYRMDISLLFFYDTVIDIFFNYLYQHMVLVYVDDKMIMSTTKEGLQQ